MTEEEVLKQILRGAGRTVDGIGPDADCADEKIEASRGLGDTIYKITTALHIPHCGGCEQRREILNNLFPYKQ